MVSLYTSQTPDLTNENDGAPGYMLGGGMYFTSPGQITHVRFYATTSVGGNYEVGVYQVTGDDDGSPSGTLLESVLLGAPPTLGTWNEVELDNPVTITPDTVLYRPVLRSSQGRYTALTGLFASAGLTNDPIVSWQTGTDPIGIGSMRNGVLSLDGSVLNYPSQGAPGGASYLIDVVFVPDGGPAEGSTATDLDLAVSATGARVSGGDAGPSVGLAVDAGGQSPNGGVATTSLDLAVDASGVRDSTSVADVGLSLAVSASGARSVEGSASLSLNLAVSATGSNGQSGRPVTPWPWSPDQQVSSYPWVPRPVRSFSEVPS